jgi:hypothetical protein
MSAFSSMDDDISVISSSPPGTAPSTPPSGGSSEHSSPTAAMTATDPIDTDVAAKMMADFGSLMGKLKTGTATKRDMKELGRLKDHAAGLVDVKTSRRTAIRKELSAVREDVARREADRDIRAVLAAVATAETVNVLVLLDLTSSMSPHKDAVIAQIDAISCELLESLPEGKLRLGVQVYRDFNDSPQYEHLEFTSSASDFKSFLSKARCFGGGDACEDVQGGIHHASLRDWNSGSAGTRILFHFADAPAHGSKYHDLGPGSDECYSSGSSPKTDLDSLLSSNVEYFFCRISSVTDKMVDEFNRELGSKYIQIVDTASVSDITKVVTASVLKTVMKTAALAKSKVTFRAASSTDGSGDDAGGFASPRPEPSRSIDRAPDYSGVAWESAQAFTNVSITSLSELQKKSILSFAAAAPTDGTIESRLSVRVSSTPFSEGGCRWAYRGQLRTSKGDRDYIFKQFKGRDGHAMRRYQGQIEASTIASFLAKQFNAQPGFSGPTVHFLKSHVVKTTDDKGEISFYNVERPLDVSTGGFVKFCDNTGHWEPHLFHETLARFCDFTWKATKGYMMVADLQGVRVDDAFWLTDPVILCKDTERFGDTNLGPKGISRMCLSIKVKLK